jgi:hypothetical protein
MIEVKFQFPTVAEAAVFLGQFTSTAPAATAPQEPQAQVQPTPPAAVPPAATSTEAPKRRGRPPKAQTESAAPDAGTTLAASDATAAPTAVDTPAIVPGAIITDADVRTALQKIAAKHGAQGLAEVSKFIASFGVQRVSELRVEQYADVIAAVEKAVA